MASTDERIADLQEKHFTSSILIGKVVEKQATYFGRLLGMSGYYMGGNITGAKIEHEDHKKKPDGTDDLNYVLSLTINGDHQYGKLYFNHIRPGGAPTLERDEPIELSREPEDAISQTISNRSSEEISRTVSRDVSLGTSTMKIKEDKISWDVSIGFKFEAGMRGTEGNFGSTALATFNTSVSVGGEHSLGTRDGSSVDITKKVSDSFVVPPRTKMKLVGTFDKINMEQTYRIWYPMDYQVEFYLKDFHRGRADKLAKYYTNPDGYMLIRSIDDIISSYLGHPPQDVGLDWNRDGIKDFVKDNWNALSTLEAISKKENRMIEQKGKLEYNDASDISLDVYPVGTYDEHGDFIEK